MFSNIIPTYRVGIEVQPGLLQLVILKVVRSACLIKAVITEPLAPEVVKDNKIRRFDLLQTILHDIVNVHRLWGMKAAIAVSVPMVRLQTLEIFAGLPEKEVQTEIQLSLQRDLPGLKESLAIDFVENVTAASQQKKIWFAATRQEYLMQYTQCLNAAGLKTRIIDIDIYAMVRVASHLFSSKLLSHAWCALLYTNHQHVFLLVFNQSNIQFHQQWVYSSVEQNDMETLRQLQLFRTSFPEQLLQTIFLAPACHAFVNADVIKLFPEAEVVCIQPEHFAPLISNTGLFSSERALSWIALGLGLREMPVW
jgi:Tfp pilus assembly PilM family ATPase